MVEYHEWVKATFKTAKKKGYAPSFDDNSDVVKLAAEVWHERKTELQKASEAQAERIAEEEVTVQ